MPVWVKSVVDFRLGFSVFLPVQNQQSKFQLDLVCVSGDWQTLQ